MISGILGSRNWKRVRRFFRENQSLEARIGIWRPASSDKPPNQIARNDLFGKILETKKHRPRQSFQSKGIWWQNQRKITRFGWFGFEHDEPTIKNDLLLCKQTHIIIQFFCKNYVKLVRSPNICKTWINEMNALYLTFFYPADRLYDT